ncbi:MAG: acyl carrier protein [candidate division WOR-3 bacterium]|nr:acyl carrier protein [candidate division WOR-3 bacterium]MCX7837673.1 acyl carrier protein [candidate division WOR-3 bacterium]MDW8114689.1 acyl carrier protein [candidate division WOR-3 bacterium]
MTNLFEEVKNLIVEKLHVPPEKVTEEAHFINDLNADSLDITTLLMEVNEKYGIDIPDEDAQKLDTVGKLVSYLKEKLGKE